MAGNSIEAGRSVTNKVSSILLTFTRGGELSLTEISQAGRACRSRPRTGWRRTGQPSCPGTDAGRHVPRWIVPADIGAVNAYPPTLPSGHRASWRISRRSRSCRARLGVLQDLDVAYIEKRPDAEAATSFTRPGDPAGASDRAGTGVARVLVALHRRTGHHPWASGLHRAHRDLHGALPALARGDPADPGRGLAAGNSNPTSVVSRCPFSGPAGTSSPRSSSPSSILTPD